MKTGYCSMQTEHPNPNLDADRRVSKKLSLSAIKYIIRSLKGRRHRNADLIKSVDKLLDAGCHICTAMLALNSAKPPLSHSGLIFL